MAVNRLKYSHYFSFFVLINLLTQACLYFCMTGQLTSSEHAKCPFIITETSLNIEHKEHRHVLKNFFMSVMVGFIPL